MRRTLLIFATGFILGAFAGGSVTEWPRLFRISKSGTVARGVVINYDGMLRGKTQIKVLDPLPEYIVEANCFGFPCEPGSEVRIVVLPSDHRVFFIGDDLHTQLLLASFVTFLIAPLAVGGGLAYSFHRLSGGRGKESPLSKTQVEFFRALPVLMCAGLVVSTVSSWTQHLAIGRYQSASLIFAITGSFFYLTGSRFVQRKGLRTALTWGAFAMAALTAMLDIRAL